jgi:DNA modification methylase
MPEEKYQEWQREFLLWCHGKMHERSVLVYNHKDRHQKGELIMPEAWFPPELHLFNRTVWNRKSTHNHAQNYAYPIHEWLFVFRKYKRITHYFNRCRLDSVVTVSPDRNNPHNAPFPLELVRLFIHKFCPKKGTVCDPFAGSATTMIAAYQTGRSFVGTELKPEYFELGVERFTKFVKEHK